LYTRTNRPLYYSGDRDYKIVTTGTSFKLGVPYSEFDRVFFGIGLEQLNVDTTFQTPLPYQNYVLAYGRSTLNVPFTIGWARDKRDSAIIPSRGTYQQFNSELGTSVGDLQYYRVFYQHQVFIPVRKTNTLSLNGEVGYGDTYNGKPFPVTKNYYAGGIGSVRGYEPFSLGPFYENNGIRSALGGSSRLIANAEYTFPVPGSGVDRTLRIFAFTDAGNVFDGSPKLSGLRASYGLGLSWISPLGPLKFSLGRPLNSKPGDKLQRFQFQIGSTF